MADDSEVSLQFKKPCSQRTDFVCKVWPLFIESQQAILSATQFVIEMNRFVKDPKAHDAPVQQMQELHTRIDGLLTFAHGRTQEATSRTTDPETTAAQALRCMSIVKLNRSDHLLIYVLIPIWPLLTLCTVPASNYIDTAPSLTCQSSQSPIATSSKLRQTST
jgi:hypothetical protein